MCIGWLVRLCLWLLGCLGCGGAVWVVVLPARVEDAVVVMVGWVMVCV